MAQNAKDKTQETTDGTVATRTDYDTDALRGLSDFDAAVALVAAELGAAPVAADEELGDGFALLDNKDTLCGVPLLFMAWSFHPGDFGEFVSARVAAKQGGGLGKYIVNDGGTGIYAQLREFTDRTGRMGGLIARRGMRKSEYENEYGPGVTYYIDTSA